MDTYHFISDLHLCEERPDITAALLDYLRGDARQTQNLFVLGDLFEVWIGDDATSPLIEKIITAFKELSNTGVKLYFCHGNRDFLIGERFSQQTGFTLLGDTHEIDICGQPTLVMHGDTLCSDDKDYLAFREMVRNPIWQQELLSKSIEERLTIAKHLRSQSQQAATVKSMQIMDVNPTTVEETFKNNHVSMIVHGHTHRPAIHQLEGNIRIVLGDWDKQAWLFRVDKNNFELKHWPIK